MATTLSLVVIFVPVSFMSSISGRFLYQFGITAAVAVMVSLLVSFTLTPMMSARLLRAEDTAGGHDASRSRRGFYAWIDWAYAGMLAFCMRKWMRPVVALLALGVIYSSIPLYKMLKQEFIPSDADEAEFQVSVTAPEGTSLAAMDEVMQAVTTELRAIPGIQLVMATSGVSSWARSTLVRPTCAWRRTRSARSHSRACGMASWPVIQGRHSGATTPSVI